MAGLGRASQAKRKKKERKEKKKQKKEKNCFSKLFLKTKNNFFLLLVSVSNLFLGTKVLLNTILFFFCFSEQKNKKIYSREQKHFFTNKALVFSQTDHVVVYMRIVQ